MKVAIQVLGSLGDVMPYITTAKALQARGARVSLLAPRDYTHLITGAGIAADPPPDFTLSGWMQEAAARGTLSGPAALFRDWADMIAPHVDDVMMKCIAAARGADIVVANLICAPARVAAEAHGAAFMLTAQQPVLSPTRHHPCAMVWRPWMGSIFNRSSYAAVALAQRIIGVALARHRRRLGLPARPLAAHLGQPLTRVTTISPPLLDRAPPDWTPHDRLAAYPSLLSAEGAGVPAGLDCFLQNGPPPVYVGLGSLGPSHGEALADAALMALDRTGLRGIFPQDLPDGRIASTGHFVSGHVAHDCLFPRCAVIVHHGGAGTTDTALRAGVPQIIQPHMLDQFWFAAGLKRLGVAGAPLPAKGIVAGELIGALSKAQAPAIAGMARHLRARAMAEDGASALAGMIVEEAERFAAGRD